MQTNLEFLARVVAAASSDKLAATRHKISKKTVIRYRARVAADPGLATLTQRGQAQGRVFQRQHSALAGRDTGPPGLAQPEPVVDDLLDDLPTVDFDQRAPDSDMVA